MQGLLVAMAIKRHLSSGDLEGPRLPPFPSLSPWDGTSSLGSQWEPGHAGL